MNSNNRIERDLLGERRVPPDAFYGIHTVRALENFSVSGLRVAPALIQALAAVKKACARANRELGFLGADKESAMLRACDEIAAGGFSDQFPLDALQGGAGTSTNMNVNEVIANRAIELLGGTKGDYALVHPIEDVNRHQSTNDVYPTALKIAAIRGFRSLSKAAEDLQGAFQQKEKEFARVVMVGKTELQEAVPMTLGAVFSGFAGALGRDRWRTFKCEERLRVVNLGGTAVGTGLTAPRQFIFLAVERLREITGLGLARADNLVDETANADPFVEASAILKAHAVNLIKIAGDLRLMNLSGEIALPAAQAGSSIMPGKVNPVICEMAIQAGMKAVANDALVADAVSRGTLQISEFLPLAAHALLESLGLLRRADEILAGHVRSIRHGEERCRETVDRSVSIVTALLPAVGYDRAAALVKEFGASGETDVRAFLARALGRAAIDDLLSPERLTSLGYDHERKDA
ncbi:MAG TPA: aspartate ammonia-lyase [bacterium]|nr:aspartate ammonia-lyase [bacterium]